MATWLQQSTGVTVAVGPAVDETDGRTIETGLTITPSDVRLRKAEGSWAAKNESTNASHTENGWYDVPLNTTDTNTLGSLIISINETGALPMWREFIVVPTNVYLSYFGTDKLEVDLNQIAGSVVNVATAQLGVNAVQIAGTAQTTGDLAARIGVPVASLANDIASVQADTDNIQTRLPAALVSGRMDSSVGAMAADVITAAATAADMLAEVKTQVTDALNVDTYAEPGQATPAATTTLVSKIGYLYKFLRNRTTVTSTTISVYNDDATTVGQKSTHSDDATTYDRGEFTTGP